MKISAIFRLACVSLIFLLYSTKLLQAKILMVSPHPDDDVITSSGIIAQAVARGEPVQVVFMTNGDAVDGTVAGYQRQGEAVTGESILGVPENDLIFLGYPDGGLSTIYSNYIALGTRFVSPNGISATYGNRGLGHIDYHTYRFGVAADYNRANILTDLQSILTTFLPDQILVTSEFDVHPDHSTTYQLVKLAVAAVNSSNPSYIPTIHKTIVHWSDGSWPSPMDPTSYFTPIPNLTPDTGLAWSNRESLDVPVSMQSNTCSVNPKCQAISAHASQSGISSLGGYIHKDEFFFVENIVGAHQPPIVNAGPSQTVKQGQTVQLDGTQSTSPGGATLTYQWVQRAGPPVILSDAASAAPSFVAPNGLLEDTSLSFDLVVSNGNFTSLPDSVGILVTGTLTVTPATALSATGAQGGPFTPSSATYTLRNSGNFALTWSAARTQPWVALSLNGGSLAPGATATVTVSINANAATLAAGSYSDTVTFTNTTNGSGNTTRAVNLVVTPQTQYTLTTSVTPSGAGSATANPSQSGYPSGTQVVLTAAPYTGYSFSSWSGGASGTANPLTVTITGNLSITANFTPLPGTLTATPATALGATGATGGPFTPPSATYTLQNSGYSALTWGASQTQPWVTLSLNGGSLAPGAPATVTVSLNANAASLAAGSYSDTVTFTNTTNGSGNTTRAVNLAVTTAQTPNIAPLATVTASTQNTATGQTADKAVDGVIDGYPGDYTREWATTGQGVGAWLNLAWSASYSVTQVVLYDRPNLDDNITSATLAFSDGSSIVVGPLNNNGTATTYSFPARVVTGLRMTVTGVSSSTGSVGLSEIQVYGIPAGGTQYTLTTSVTPSGAGSATANPSQSSYPSGTQVVLTAAPNTGYSFSSWSGGASGTANPLTVTITGYLSVTANFAAEDYTLTYSAGANGTLSGTTPQTVSTGGSGSQVTAVANTGYHFVSWSDGAMTAARTDTNLTANISVTANFAANGYTLTYSAGANGTISGTTPQSVSFGGSGTQVTAVANTGYHFVSWSDGALTAARTDANLTANISVTANFAATSLLVTGSVTGGNGTISCTPTATYGGSASCTTAPNAGYHLFALTDNNADRLSAVSGGIFTISAITVNHTVNAVFGRPNGIVNQVAGKTTPDITDALAVLLLVLKNNPTAADIARADIAPLGADGKPLGDGKLDIYDVIGILRMTIGLD